MANQGAKKRKEENARHMARLRYLIIACNVIYVLLRMIIFHSTFTWKNWIGLVITSAAYAIPYLQLASMAKPSYADDGDLLDGGFDMSTGGICGYLVLAHTNLLASLRDSWHPVSRVARRMKNLGRREREWRKEQQEENHEDQEQMRTSFVPLVVAS